MARSNAVNFSGALQFPMANAATDLFKKEDVQTLALAVDGHDHSSGKGLILPASAIPDGAITSAKIADGTITTIDLAASAITQSDIVTPSDGQSTTTGTLAAIPNTSVSLNTTGGTVLVWAVAPFKNNTNVDGNFLGIGMDGSFNLVGQVNSNNTTVSASGFWRFVPGAGSHTFQMAFATGGGTLSVVAGVQRILLVVELKR
jgi:hypothetical protein